jgi:hypothetical protein
MIYLPVNSMKLNPNKSSTQQLISEFKALKLHKPNPPTAEAIERAQFKNRTFRWNGK